jgi:AsmA protein
MERIISIRIVRLALSASFVKPIWMVNKLNGQLANTRWRRAARWSIIGAAGLFVAVGFASLALPYLVNQPGVITRLETELTRWAGSPVHIHGGIEFSIFPSFHVQLNDVATQEALASLSLSAPKVAAQISVFDALLGQLRVTSLTVDDAKVIYRLGQGDEAAKIAAPVRAAVATTQLAVQKSAANPDLSGIANDALGAISFTNSTLSIFGHDGVETRVSNLNAMLKWPKLQSGLAFTGDAMWRGEPVALDATISAPLLFAAGGGSVLDLNFKSPPLTFKFSGNASRASVFYADGRVKLIAPSLDRFLSWSHADIDAGNSVGELSLDSQLTTANGKFRFDDLVMSMSGNKATGSLELDPAVSPPNIVGTFAFETVDLTSLAKAFSIAVTGRAQQNFSFLNQVDIDLRLSSNVAKAGDITISDAAGAIRIANGNADFDLGDGSFAGGHIKGGLRLTGAEKLKTADLHLNMSDVVQELIPNIPTNIPTIAATLSGTIALQGPFSSLKTLLEEGTGTFSLSSGTGMVRNFNLESFVTSIQSGTMFSLPTFYSGLSSLQSCTIDGTVSNGVAVIEAGELNIGSKRVVFAGALPFQSHGVALNGVMTSTDATAADELLPFFLGGTWSEPFVTMMTKLKQ